MLNYSSFYGNFSVEDNADDDSITPFGEVEHAAFLLYWLCNFVFCNQANKVTLEFAHLADYLAQGGRPALGPFLLGHIYRTLHNVVTDGMKPKHGGPLWAFQFWLQAYFPELRGAVHLLLQVLLRADREDRVAVPGVPCSAIWGSFLVARDLHCSLSRAGVEVYLPHCVARQFGLIQTAPLPPLSLNRLSSWRADVSQQHDVAGISFQLQKGMTFITLRPWMRRNAVDGDGRLWYEECTSARFIRPVEEAVRVALKNADWDPLLPKASKGKKVLAVPSRPSTPVVGGPRMAALPSARPAAAALTAASTPRAPAVTGARKTLAHRTVPSTSPARPVAAAAPGRKRGREVLNIEAAVVEVMPAESVVAETASSECPKKKVLLDLSEGEDEEEAPLVAASEAPPVTEAAAAEAMIEVSAAEVVVEEEAAAEAMEMLDAEMPEVDEGPAAEETVVELSDGEVIAERPAQTVLAGVPSASIAVPTPTAPASAGSVPFIPRRPGGIRIGSSVVVTASAVAEGQDGGAPSPLPVSSGVLTELVATGVLGASSAAEELFANLHEERGSSASAPLDEDTKAVIERHREFLLCDAYQMTSAEAFAEFRSYMDAAMAMGLLDSAQLDELQIRLAESEEMLGR
ncbi:unnamed protein product [Prunus brigantina]